MSLVAAAVAAAAVAAAAAAVAAAVAAAADGLTHTSLSLQTTLSIKDFAPHVTVKDREFSSSTQKVAVFRPQTPPQNLTLIVRWLASTRRVLG